MVEKRRFRRTEAKLPVYCRIGHGKNKSSLSNVIEAYSKNVSRGGLLLTWPRSWVCDKCSHCLAWIFNLDCKLKEEPYREATRNLSRKIPIVWVFPLPNR